MKSKEEIEKTIATWEQLRINAVKMWNFDEAMRLYWMVQALYWTLAEVPKEAK